MNNLTRTLILGSVLVLTACAEDDPQTYIEEGKVLFEKADYKAAQVQFKNALQLNPEASEAYYSLALLAEKTKEWPAMKMNLQEAIRLDPSLVDAHVKLGFLLIGDLDKAEKEAKIALKLDPEKTKVLLLDGRIKFERGLYPDALKQVNQVLEKDATSEEAYWLKATVLMGQKKMEQAREVIEEGLSIKPDSIGLAMLKINWFKEQKQFEQAFKVYDDLLVKQPEDKKLHRAYIKALVRYGKPEQVEQKFVRAIGQFPADIGFKTAFIDYLKKTGNSQKLEQWLKDFIASSPKDIVFKSHLAQLYRSQNRIKNARVLFTEITQADPKGQDGLSAKLALAEMTWSEGDKQQAEALIDKVLADDPENTQGMLFRAEVYLERKEIDKAISDLRLVLRDKPNNDRAMLMMAQVHLLKGEQEVAESYWRKALDANPGNLKALTALNSELIKRGDSERAEDLLRKSIKSQPDNLALRELMVKFRFYQQDWAAAESEIKTMEKKPGAKLTVVSLKAILAEKQGRLSDAISVFKEALTENPDMTLFLNPLFRLYVGSGRLDEYLSFLQQFIKQNPDKQKALNELGRVYALNKQWNRAEAVLMQVLEVNDKNIQSYKLLVGVYAQQEEQDKSIEILRSALVKMPEHPVLQVYLADSLAATGDTDQALPIYKRVLEKFPENNEVANNIADLLLSKGKSQSDYQRALELTRKFKETSNPYFLDTYGWALFKNGKVAEALSVLEKAAKALPEDTAVKEHLNQVKKVNG